MRTRFSNQSWFGLAAAGVLLLLFPIPAAAGGPLVVGGPAFGVEGQPFTWSTATEIQYRTDNGPLSSQTGDDEASARARVASLFQVWEDVATANIGYNRAGFILPVPGFAGGDVDTGAELTALENDCSQAFIVYDANGQIFDDLGVDTTSVIGFAGPCSVNSLGNILGGRAVMNGLFTDGVTDPDAAIPNPADISNAEFDAAFIHEFGHFSGLDHSQINVNCLSVCGADDLTGLPTMFPILVSVQMASLATDDIAWISRLYPQATGGTTFASTHGTLAGTVRFSDGMTHAQGVNVIARPVDTGSNQDRKFAVSVVSGFKFTGNPGQSVTAAPYLNGASDNTGGDGFGSRQTSDIGRFEIPVPTGSYTVEVETINSGFDGGSSVGPLDPPIPMPGTAPAATAPIAVTAGGTSNVGDIVLVGTDPRFDAFEGGKKRRAQTISE
jgi:hypothetical protein